MNIVSKWVYRASFVLASALMAATTGSVQAGVIFLSGVPPEAGSVSNVRFLSTLPGVDFGPDTTVTGKVGNMPYLVDFSANETMLAFDQPAIGTTPAIPPSLRATDGVLHALDMRVRGGAFSSFFYNLRLNTLPGNPTGRFANVQVTGFDGSITNFSQELRNGNNLLFIRADDDLLLRNIFISSISDIAELRQFRVGGLEDAPVPEPGMLWSFALGALILRACHLRRHASTPGRISTLARA